LEGNAGKLSDGVGARKSGIRRRPTSELLDRCGGYQQAIDATVSLARALREVAFVRNLKPHTDKNQYFWEVNLQELHQTFNSQNPSNGQDLFPLLLDHLAATQLCFGFGNVWGRLSRSAFQPVTLARELIKDLRPDHELRYFVMANIRKHWNRTLSSETAHEFHILTNLLNSAIKIRTDFARHGYVAHDKDLSPLLIRMWEEMSAPRRDENSPKGNRGQKKYGGSGSSYHVGQSQSWDYQDILKILQLAQVPDSGRAWDPAINAFIECCLAVNYLQPHDKKHGWVVLRTNTVDSAFLLSNLFGMMTGITGFDELFGGGGLMLADEILPGISSPMGGRAILTMGRYGTCKSLLSLQFAIEVARKGGLAYLMTVEQSPEECLYSLGSVCAFPPRELVEIATNAVRARRVLERQQPGRGALILVNPLKDSFQDFLATFKKDMEEMRQYQCPLRLVIVDAITAIPRDQPNHSEWRNETLNLLQEAKRAGTNIWLVAEEGSENLVHYENISDTVIRLSVEEVLPYSQRYFEIAKSRFQREQRGKHPFSIQPGSGFSIFPSAAAVSARIQPRSVRPPDTPVRFGVEALDRLLGENAICKGDVIVLQGPPGTFKTPLGLRFLLGVDKPGQGFAKERRTESLLVSSDDDSARLGDLLPPEGSDELISSNRRKNIRICSITGGYVRPGYILHKIEEEFLAARLTMGTVDRVMVDNVSHWGLSFPFIQEEKTFGDTLVDLLRRHQVTSLFTCSEFNGGGESALQQAMVHSADCLIQFHRIEFRGTHHVMLRVLKTRGMKHRRESFELVTGPFSFDVKTNSSFLRVSADGSVEALKVRLFLHDQTPAQHQENKKIVGAIHSIVSPHVSVETEAHDTATLVKAWSLGASSALDELQVLQIDEFQLPDVLSYYQNQQALPVHVFAANQWSSEWNDLVPRLRRRIQFHHGNFIGMPMYENVALLAYRFPYDNAEGAPIKSYVNSWEELADQCERWEQRNDPKHLFFDFAASVKENYNCLFIEILLSFLPASSPSRSSKPRLIQEWLAEEQVAAIRAARLFRRLCRRAHFARKSDALRPKEGVDRKAIVWRLWYSELNEMLSTMERQDRDTVIVSALPGKISVAGEWYLTVPAYSAAPDVGLEIIKLLTTHESELTRLEAGLGLPTRSSFYTGKGDNRSLSEPVPVDFRVLYDLVNKAFSRSSFKHYGKLSGIATAHLQRIVELPDADDAQLESEITRVFSNFRQHARFVGA
jgi:KaiC/GvpD/RAD55 family RecA-like ATPase